MPLNLKSRKIESLKCMLNFNKPETKTINYDKFWKILVCDQTGLDIVSTLFTKNEIKDLGVTLTLKLNAEREPIPDVPTIYFMLSTADNIGKLCKDIETGLYDHYYVNFISSINREKLETIGYSVYQSDCASQISKIYDQYTNFVCLENNLFTLPNNRKEPVYLSMNRPGQTDKEIDLIINDIVDSLYSVCITMGSIPIIRCPAGNAAEMVAKRLDKKIRDNLRDNRNSLFTGVNNSNGSGSFATGNQFNFDRPLLVILDRCIDIATPLHHPWTYQALVHDILGLRNHHVKIPKSGSNQATHQAYELWCDNDEFWLKQRHKPLPEIADVIQQELELIKAKEKEINQLKSNVSTSGDSIDNSVLTGVNEVANSGDNTTAMLEETVSSLGEFLKKKKLLEVHTTIVTYLVDKIKERKLDMYYELEEKMQAKQQLQDKSVIEVISSESPDGSGWEDKLRLLLLGLLYENAPVISSGMDNKQFVEILMSHASNAEKEEAEGALKHVKQVHQHNTLGGAGRKQYGAAGGIPGASGASSGSGSSGGLFTKFMSHGQAYIMEGIKSLVAKKHKLPFTRMVHHLMEQKSDPDTDNFKYFDPKLYRYNEGDTIPRHKAPFSDAIVFVIGGGSYNEYQNLMEYSNANSNAVVGSSGTGAMDGGVGGMIASQGGITSSNSNSALNSMATRVSGLSSNKNICYGSTEILSAQQFLTQFSKLGIQQ